MWRNRLLATFIDSFELRACSAVAPGISASFTKGYDDFFRSIACHNLSFKCELVFWAGVSDDW